MLSLRPLLLALLLPLAHCASGTGEISLWSDSGCGDGDTTNFGERDPVALNYTLSADVCGTPGAAVHSYRVLQRPTCANGTTAAFAFYHGVGCKPEGFGPALNSNDGGYTTYDGECLALVEFNSLAFICDGLESSGSTSASTSSPPETISSGTTPSASATPIAPSASMTLPLYTVSTASTLQGSFPTGTAASSIRPSAGSPAQSTIGAAPSPLSFTGAASRFEGSVIGIAVVFGGAILV